ncbi:MAG: sigma-70 family RNA polymerase sigma factor [Pseudomonadota bacterium]
MSRFSQEIPAHQVAAAAAGDARAQEAIYRTFCDAVYSLASRLLGRPDLAEEILQDTFVEVLRHLGKFRGDAPLGAWIRSIAVNKCLMHFRSAWVRYSRSGEEMWDLLQHTRDGAPAAQASTDLEGAMAHLTPTARTVVWMYDVEGYTHREIGAMMGKTTSFSKSQLARAHKRLRDALDDQSGTATCTQTSNSF